METSSKAAAIDPVVPMIDPAPAQPERTHSSGGSVVAILLIVLLLVIGAFYVWSQRLEEQRAGRSVPTVGS